MKTVMFHPTGNANVRAAALGLLKSNELHSFHTSIASFPGNLFGLLGKFPMLSEFNKRGFDPDLQYHTHMWPWLELARILSLKAGFSKLIAHETGVFSIDAIYNKFDKHIATYLPQAHKDGANAVYAFEDGAFSSFEMAHQLQMKCIYDLPIGYWRTAHKLMAGEHERWPQWAATLTGFVDSNAKLERKDNEIKLADKIIVASTFTASSLADYPGVLPEVKIVPYGFPPIGAPRNYLPLKGRPLNVLFVGGLSQRKGLADLFQAAEELGSEINLTIVGRKTTAECKALDDELKKYNWIPSLSHAEILKLMRNQDVLVFPSLFEGFGLVITEAMSQGTPVITTNRTVGQDVITHGRNGWIIEAGSSKSIKDAIEYLIKNPDQIASAGIAARELASKRNWQQYGLDLVHNLY
jgi:Glycosyltransferase